MPVTNAILSFEDVRELLNKAIEAEKGIEIKLDTKGQAVNLRSRMNRYRAKDRESSKVIFPDDHPSYGVSQYDRLIISIREDEGKWVVRAEVSSAANYEVTEIK